MIGCQSTLAGHCVSWSPLRVIMVTLLWSGALLTLDRVRIERGGR